MSNTVDARGLSCPQPVILARQALSSTGSGKITVLVDNPTARDNVSRAARSMGWTAEVVSLEDEFKIELIKPPV